MLKPASLRAHLTAATPDLKTNPDKLTVFVEGGRLVCTGAGSLSFEYRYTLKLIVLDYRGHPDAIMVPLLAWVSRHQVELLDNADLRDKSIRFEVEILNAETYDLSIEVDLTKHVSVKPGTEPTSDPTHSRYNITHLGEPPHIGLVTEPEHWELWLKDEKLAEWDFAPPHR